MNTNLGRTNSFSLTNKSGTNLAQGAVGIVDNANAESFKTTTTPGLNTSAICVIHEPGGIADNAAGIITTGGPVPKVLLDSSANPGDFIKCANSAGLATPHAPPMVDGDFGIALDSGTSPRAILFGGLPLKLSSTPSNLVQVVTNQTGAMTTGTTTIPLDDTIPQNTEGTEFLTLSITPTNALNKIIVRVEPFFAASLASWIIVALFKDSGADALAVQARYTATANTGDVVPVTYVMVAGTTAPITFKIRAGLQTAGTITFNGTSGARKFGGAMGSIISIQEVLP